jgi:hypothetical protein
MTIVVLSVVGFASLAGAQTATCAQNLIPCANYINSSTPAANCCSSIKDAVNTQLECLCGLYTSPGLLPSLGITLEQALNLSRACGVTTDLSKCNGIFFFFNLLIIFVFLLINLNQIGFGPPAYLYGPLTVSIISKEFCIYLEIITKLT